MNVGITGSSGLVGETLASCLKTEGHRVISFVRQEPAEGQGEWHPPSGRLHLADSDTFEGDNRLDAFVHLAGENVAGGRWNAALKERIRSSRVEPTRLLSQTLAAMDSPPQVLVCASAIGFYGDRADEVLDEQSGAGSGFLAETAQRWEDATEPAHAAGIRVVNLRFGIILSPKGGALKKVLLPFKLGAGGRVGSGRQYWSWISIDDTVRAIHHALVTEELTGPVNVTAPEPVTNAAFTKTLARVLSRPAFLPLPAFAARAALGEMADEMLLSSQRVTPKRLLESGFQFRHQTLEQALRHLLGR